MLDTGGVHERRPSRLGMAFGALLAVLTMTVAVVDVSAVAADVGGPIVPLHSELCLEAEGGSTDVNARIVQTVCDSSSAQAYEFRDVGGGLVELVNRASGLCLAVEDASMLPGASVRHLGCDRGSNSLFQRQDLFRAGELKVQHSAMCLDIRAASVVPGTDLLQWPCHGLRHQQFDWQTGIVELPPADEVVVLPGAPVADPVVELPPADEVVELPAAPVADPVVELPPADEVVELPAYVPTDDVPVLPGASPVDAGNTTGSWGAITDIGLVPVAMANLPSGEILMWSSYEELTLVVNGFGYTETAIFNPDTGSVRRRQVSETQHDMFCPGIANMADGRVMITGGSNNAEASVYNPSTDTWEDAADMNIGRGYHSNVTLADGSVLAVGGSWSGGVATKDSEIYRNGSWTKLPGIKGGGSLITNDAQGQYRSDNHMWLFAWKNNRVFHAGPAKTMHWLDVSGQGSVQAVGLRGSDGDAMNGNAVMYDEGKILVTGGGLNYNSGQSTGNAHVIDLNAGGVARQVQSLEHPRAQHISVVLPSGEVVALGGKRVIRLFDDQDSVLVPELFDPDTETWSSLAPMSVPRNYHSSGLLLHDGRILVGGGGLCGGCSGQPEVNHPDVQILTPPYLLDSSGALKPRPVINAAPASADYGQSVTVNVRGGASEFALVRLANSTHSTNNGQRRIPVTFSAVGGGNYQLSMPTGPGVAPPGSYMLFALDAAGTPSLSTSIMLD